MGRKTIFKAIYTKAQDTVMAEIILEIFKSPEIQHWTFSLLDTSYILLIKYQSTLSSKL